MQQRDEGSQSSQQAQDIPVILFSPPPYMEVLADLQTKRVESLTNFNLKCKDNYEIPVHAILFQMWIPLESMPKNLQRKLQPIAGIDLQQFTVAELAPVVMLLYKRVQAVQLTEKAKQAIEMIKDFLKDQLQVEIVPPNNEDVEVGPLAPDAKFRCLRTNVEGNAKEYHFIISTGVFLEICEKCDFSGSAGELEQHILKVHATSDQPGVA